MKTAQDQNITLEQRTHRKELVYKSVNMNDLDVFVRMLYKDSYWRIDNHTDIHIVYYILCCSYF